MLLPYCQMAFKMKEQKAMYFTFRILNLKLAGPKLSINWTDRRNKSKCVVQDDALCNLKHWKAQWRHYSKTAKAYVYSPLSPLRLGIDGPLCRHSHMEDGKTFRYRHITSGILIMASKTRTNRRCDTGEEKNEQSVFPTRRLPQEISLHFLWVWLRRLRFSCIIGMYYKGVLSFWNKRSPVVWI